MTLRIVGAFLRKMHKNSTVPHAVFNMRKKLGYDYKRDLSSAIKIIYIKYVQKNIYTGCPKKKAL